MHGELHSGVNARVDRIYGALPAEDVVEVRKGADACYRVFHEGDQVGLETLGDLSGGRHGKVRSTTGEVGGGGLGRMWSRVAGQRARNIKR